MILGLHGLAVILMAATEVTRLGMAVFVLVWVMLNCLWLAVLRRPTVAALLSLEILALLTLLSRFKYDKLWMTIDFVDVMIVDRDTVAFLLAIFPLLRWWALLAAGVTIAAIAFVWRRDQKKVSRYASIPGFLGSLIALIAVSLLWSTDLAEDFEGKSYVSKFARSGVEAVDELMSRGYLEAAEYVSEKPGDIAHDKWSRVEESRKTCKGGGSQPAARAQIRLAESLQDRTAQARAGQVRGPQTKAYCGVGVSEPEKAVGSRAAADQGSSGAADSHGRHPEGDRQFTLGRAARVRGYRGAVEPPDRGPVDRGVQHY